MARFSRKSQKIKKIKFFFWKSLKIFWFFNEFPEFRINKKKSKISPKNSELETACFSRKSQKIKKNKIFEKFSDFLMNFQNLELIKNTENQQAQKMENLHVFLRKLVHVFQGKKKDGFKKRNETRSLKMDL